jgi:multiple sugar transport system substrate-binding protein
MDIKKLDRHLFSAALVALGVFALFGLIAALAKREQKTTLTFTRFLGKGLEDEVLAALIGEFEERNPEIRIKPKDGPRNGEEDFSADIIVFDEGRFNFFSSPDSFASLKPYMPEDPESDPRLIPLVSFMDLLFYNIDMLSSAGFDQPPKTRAEFLACARAARAPGGRDAAERFGAALALGSPEPEGIRQDLFSWLWASGAGVVREGSADFRGRPFVETLEFLGALNSEGLLSPGTFEKTVPEKTEEFIAGKIAMMIGPVDNIPLLRKRMGDSAFGITRIPGPAQYAGKPALGPSLWYAGISNSCKFPGQAWTFLAFLAEKSPFLAAQARAVPGNAASPGVYIEEDEFYSKAWEIYETSELIQEFSGFSRREKLEAIIREELLPFFGKQKTAAETAAAIQERWELVSSAPDKHERCSIANRVIEQAN